MRSLLLALALLVLATAPVRAHSGHPEHEPPPLLRNVDVDQRLDSEVPGNLTFKDETGKTVQLGQYFGERPVLLTLNYFECPQLCPLVLKGVSDSLQSVKFDVGKDFDIVTVSIDPRETPNMAREAKKTYLQAYSRPGAENGWHFLTGDATNIGQLAKAVGFTYNYDAKLKQFAHPSAITFVTPEARIARYLFGIDFNPRDVQLALSEASENKIGSIVDKVMFSCYRFDPQIGKYSPIAINLVRAGGILTLILMGGFIGTALVRERRSQGQMPTGRVG
ncbi:MAG: SCO family protein [Chloroflexota bacterium]|nr:SCO family protein [Chloroflexota bacterium]